MCVHVIRVQRTQRERRKVCLWGSISVPCAKMWFWGCIYDCCMCSQSRNAPLQEHFSACGYSPPSSYWIHMILIGDLFWSQNAYFAKKQGLCISVYEAKKEKAKNLFVSRDGMKQRACLWVRLLSVCMYTACSIRTIGGRLHFPSWWSGYVTSGVGSYWHSYWWKKSQVTRMVWSVDYSEML